MSDEGTSFTIDLPVTGQPGIDAAATSVDALASRLDLASKASQAAARAMAVGEESYRMAESAADKAAKAVERIGITADAQRGKLKAALDAGDGSAADRAAATLRNLMDRQSEAATKALAAKTALDAEAAALDKLKAAAATAAAEESKLGGQKPPKPAAEKAAGGDAGGGLNLEKLERGLGKIGGPLGSLGQKVTGFASGVGKLGESFGGMDAEAAAATGGLTVLAAVVVAATVALVTGVVELGNWAVGLADANRSALLLSQGIAKSVAGGQMLNDKLNSLTTTLPLTREELSGMAQKLAAGGLQGAALTSALDKAAVSAAKLKFGPDFEKQMLSLDEQSKVFKANLAGTFGGLKTDALMGAMQKLVGLFDSNSAAGKAMKVVFESVFQPLIDKLTACEPMIERFFLQFEILALKALIAIKPFGSVIMKVGEALLIGAAIITGVLVVAIGLLIAPIVEAVAIIGALGAATVWVAEKWIGAFGAVKAWLSNFSLADMGRAMIDGLVNGILGGGAAVLASMENVVTGAVTAAKKALGIASPSKVFAEIGMYTAAGMSQGVERGSSGVKSSLESMVSPPTGGAGGAATVAPAASTGGKSGVSLVGPFNFYGVEGAEDAESRFGSLLTRVLEGDVTSLGASVPTT